MDYIMKIIISSGMTIFKILNHKGMSLVEVLIGSSLLIAIGYGGVSLTKMFSQAEKAVSRSSDSERITSGAREIFSNLDICAANLNSGAKHTSFERELKSIGIYKDGILKSDFAKVDSEIDQNIMSIGKTGIASIKMNILNPEGNTFPPEVALLKLPDCGVFPANSAEKDTCLMQRTEASSLNAKYVSTKNGIYAGVAEISLEFVKCLDGSIRCQQDKVQKIVKKFVFDFQANRTPNELSNFVCLGPDSEMIIEANYNFCNSINGIFIGDKCFSNLYHPCSAETGSSYDSCAKKYDGENIAPTGFAKVNTILCDIGSRVFAKTNKFLTDYCQYKGLAIGTGDLDETSNKKISSKGCRLPKGETNDSKTYFYPENSITQLFEKTKNVNCTPKKKEDGSFEIANYPTTDLQDCCEGEIYYYKCRWDEDSQDYILDKVSSRESAAELINSYNEKATIANNEEPSGNQAQLIPSISTDEEYPIKVQRDPNILFLTVKDESGNDLTIASEVYASFLNYVPKEISLDQIEALKKTYKSNYCTNTRDITKSDFEKINPNVDR
jgi:hypothetical protein